MFEVYVPPDTDTWVRLAPGERDQRLSRTYTWPRGLHRHKPMFQLVVGGLFVTESSNADGMPAL